MKRDVTLQPLSHQHHNALMGCLLLKKGVQKKADKKVLKDFALRLFNEDIQHHMNAEEKFIYPHLDKLGYPYKTIVRREHETIRLLADRLRIHEDGYLVFSTFADFLEQHIRFEERVVFNKLQESLNDQDRSALNTSLNGLPARKCSDYPVRFWE